MVPSTVSQPEAEASGGASLNVGCRDPIPLQQPQVQAPHYQVLNVSGFKVFLCKKNRSNFYLQNCSLIT